MKYRSDFVTNSSSSSFIVAYNTPDNMVKSINKFVKNYEDDDYSNQYKSVVYDLFKKKISYTDAIKYATKVAKYDARIKYQMHLPGIEKYGNYQKWQASKEYKDLCNKYVEKQLVLFKKTVKPNSYISMINYIDSDGFFDVCANLENMLDGVVLKIHE